MPEPEGDAGTPSEREGASPPLTFPDLPRLELEQLLTQLVDRAQEVMATQGRLRGLLRANQLIVGDLALETVLHRIAEAARELVGARYAALGVISPDGGLAQFVHSGMPDDVVTRIGHLPEGKGLLGALIQAPHPIRLQRISDDDRSIGLPPEHPEMNSFLGVPIEIRGQVWGNLYLTEAVRGDFSAEDEELARALAATAAAAIANARLYEAARTRGEWLAASERISRSLLSGDITDPAGPLRLIAEESLKVARADLVTVIRPLDAADLSGHGDLYIEVAVGSGSSDLQGRRLSSAGTIVGLVLADGGPVYSGHSGEVGLASPLTDELGVGPVLAVPLTGSGRVYGVLSFCRLDGRPGFSSEDGDLAASFAGQAAVAIELGQARAAQQRTALLDDRERIAADLHDHVIQRLFGAGMSLQAAATAIPTGGSADRLLMVIDDLDATISQIRTTIFQLQRDRSALRPDARARILDVAAEVAPVLGFQPAVRFSGVMDVLRGDLLEDLLAVLREALTNVARHAHARQAEVEVGLTGGELTLDVYDDGAGPATTTDPGRGLANLRERAERHGGSMTLRPGRSSGARLRWTAALA